MGNKIGSQHSPRKVQVKLVRGVPVNKEELATWYKAPAFPNLDKRGQEAFFKFLRGDIYSEEKDVIDIPITADGMDGDAKRYQFWLKCENLNLGDLFEVYVVDDETKLKDAKDSYEAREKMKEKALDVDNYVSDLKEKMKPDLDEQFSKFKKYLDEYAKELES